MDADEDGAAETVRDVNSLLERNSGIGCSRHFHPITCPDKFAASGERDVECENFLAAKITRGAVIRSTVPGIQDHGLHFLRLLDPARPQDRLDYFADVHDRDEVFAVVVEQRKVGEEPDAVDRYFTGPSLGADRPALTPERDGPADPGVLGELIELGHVRERDIRTVVRADDRPIVGYRGANQENGDGSANQFAQSAFGGRTHARSPARNRNRSDVQAGATMLCPRKNAAIGGNAG